MRKIQQKLILELLQTLEEATVEIKRLFSGGDQQTLVNLLADCQEGAIQIGHMIEELAGDGQQVVALLEEYCQLLYMASTGTEQSIKICQQLQEQIKTIRKYILNHLQPDQLEVVFMPYNAAMWDSLESIWLAAKADPACDVYVVPIPYCSRNPDGSVREIHYDGAVLPDYVPVMSYKAYDLETRRPDIIYIHNPYDQYNYVTSVLPKFYSYELKKYTDMLVYVPYFVSGELLSEKFCSVNAALHVDQIIAQSEAVKRSYAKVAGEKKVAALGSPKIDKVVRSRREDQQMPEEWQKMIGTKKVVLYNTHLKSILVRHERFIAKLKEVFAIFRQREDVILWWRPHPLSEDTIRSMKPALWQEYSALVEEYKRNRFGIYDDTKDLHRAIVFSDAYYGDISSVLYMYQTTGKPILLQDTNLNDQVACSKEKRVGFLDCAATDNDVWFVSYMVNGLFHLDLQTQELVLIASIPNEYTFDNSLVGSMEKQGDNLVLIPWRGSSILTYHIPKGTFSSAPLHMSCKNNFGASLVCGDHIFLIPRFYPALVKYCSKTGEVLENVNLCLELDQYRQDNSDFYFFKGGLIRDGCLMLPSGMNNLIIKYDPQTDVYTKYRVGNSKSKYTHIVFDGNDYWLFCVDGTIMKWNDKTNKVKAIRNFPQHFNPGRNYSYIDVIFYEGNIYVFPYHANMIMKIEPLSEKITCLIDFEKGEEKGNKEVPKNKFDTKYLCVRLVNDLMYAYSLYHEALQIFNPQTGEIKSIPLILSEDELGKVMNRPFSGEWTNKPDTYFSGNESPLVSLELFLERLATEEMTIDLSSARKDGLFANADGSCGEKTHAYIKSFIM